MTTFITQFELNNIASNIANYNLEILNVTKKTTKNVRLAVSGETIITYIDVNDTITEEVSRIVPNEGTFVVISDKLKNSSIYNHEYFIPIEDFLSRYVELNGNQILPLNITTDYKVVKAIGNASVFKNLPEFTPNGLYENPNSWGGDSTPASGANTEGYWMASVQKPKEWYFVPIEHFNRDYQLL